MSLTELIEVNPRKLGGAPVFKGTRIPIATFFDYLEAGRSVDDFIAEYEIEGDLVHRFVRTLRCTLVPEAA